MVRETVRGASGILDAMEAEGVPVAWCTTREIRCQLEKTALSRPVTWTSPDDPFGNEVAAVLDTRAFGTTPALLEVRHTRPECPVLVVCAPEEVTEVAAALELIDEIALHDAPAPLLVFRLRRLLGVTAFRDSLTGLFNRSIFIRELQQAGEDPDRMPLSLLLVDLDRFKGVNDTYGHAVGDETLKEAAARIARAAPPGAVMARLGGDEFGVLHTLSPSDAVAVAERIRTEFHASWIHGMDITVSIGCATVKTPGQSLFKPADSAVYSAKAKGRNCVVHYDEIERRAREEDRDPAFESFEDHTRVVAERIAELITRRGRKLFAGLREQADVDALTALFSRRYLDRRLTFEFEVSSEQNTPLTVALLDIDHFGAVNKTHGWPTGDRVLAEVAARIRANTRTEDWAARYGGEEICIVMHGTALGAARPVLERVRSAVCARKIETTGDVEIEVTLSGGAAERDGEETLATLMERVSRNLLLAKQGGRNRIVT